MIRVAIVDDQDLIRGGLRMILEATDDIEVVGEAATGAEAITLVHTQRPDVVLMDIQMPEMNGIEATRRIVATESPTDARTHVLILTTFDHDDFVYAALRAGASGFLLKTAPPARLVDAVRLVAEGEALLAPTLTRRLIQQHLSRPDPHTSSASITHALTAREVEVTRLIARGRSNAEIAGDLFIAETTVKTHVNRILSKLGLRDRVHVVVLAYESGLVEPGDAGPAGPAAPG